MATRFMHTILAFQTAQKLGLSDGEQIQWIMGSLLPDAVARSEKRTTHFNGFPGSIKRNSNQLEQRLIQAPYWVRMGWLFHLDLDDLWQTTCMRPRLFLAPLFILRYGLGVSKIYYQELSHYDVVFRQRLAPEVIDTLRNELEVLLGATPEQWTGICREQWKTLIQKVLEDLTKESSYNGPWMIGEKCFWNYCHRALSLIRRPKAH